MGERYWLWVMARLLVAVAIVASAASYIGTGNGEKEFQKTLEAMKQVHSFRMAATSHSTSDQTVEMLWEVDCNQNIAHYRWHVSSPDGSSAKDFLEDQTFVAGQEYDRNADGAWVKPRYTTVNRSSQALCGQIVQGTDNPMMPQIETMIRRGVIQKADKKIVNGVRCREWHVTLKGGINGLEHDTVCIGLEDHLPYELTIDWMNSHASYSDYNVPLHIDVPDAAVQAPVVQPAATTESSSEN